MKKDNIAKIDKRLDEIRLEIKTLTAVRVRLERLLDDEDRNVSYRYWKCSYTECDHGMGLAGRDSCPGDPRDKDCAEFTTEFSDYKGSE